MQIWFKKYQIYFLALFTTFLVVRPIDNFDIWWYLNSGLWILEHGQILDYEIWSFTEPDSAWVNVSWLFQIFIALVYKFFDLWGLFIFKFLSVFFIFYAVAISIKAEKAKSSYILSILILLPFIYGFIHLRSNLIEVVSLVSLVLLSQKPCNARIVTGSFLILLILANCHASAIVGSVAFTLHLIFSKWDYKVTYIQKSFFAFLILLTPFLTPVGFSILPLLLSHDGSDFNSFYIAEWFQYENYPLTLWLSVIAVTFFALSNKIKITLVEVFLLLFFFLYSYKYQRFQYELAIILIRPLAEIIGYGFSKIDVKFEKLPSLIFILILLIHGMLYSNQLLNLAPSLYSSLPLNKFNYPTITTKQITKLSEALSREIKVINDYDYGGYIPFFSNSNAKIFVDGRMNTVYPDALLMVPYESDAQVLKNLAKKHDADAVLLKLDKASLISINDPDWQLVAYDSASVLFVRRTLIVNHSFPDIKYNPSQYMSSYNSHELKAHKNETLKLLKLDADNPVALNHIAVLLSSEIDSVKSREVVLDYLKKSYELNPKDTFAKATAAYVLITTTTNIKSVAKKFLGSLPKSDELASNINLSYDLVFARALIDFGLSNEAIKYLYPKSKERRYQIDKIVDTWKLRIIAHNELGELSKAKNCLEIAFGLVSVEDHVQINNLNELEKLIF